jgi:hypothetical protein
VQSLRVSERLRHLKDTSSRKGGATICMPIGPNRRTRSPAANSHVGKSRTLNGIV